MTGPNTGNTHVPSGTDSNGAITITPQTGAPIKSAPSAPTAPNAAVSAASDAARALIASQGTAQPRASDGTFGEPLPAAPAQREVPAPVPAAEVAPTPGPVVPAPVEGEAVPEQTPEEVAAAAALAERVVTIELAEGNAIDLDMSDPAIAAHVRAAFETAHDATAIREESERAINDALAIRDLAEIDPVGFAQRALAKSPAGQDHLVLSLLSQPEVFERVRATVEAMIENPDKLELVRAQQQAARGEYAQQAQHEREEQAAVRQNLNEVKASCAAMARLLPNEAAQGTVYNDMLRDLMAYADQANVTVIPPEAIPVILTSRLTAIGLDPMQAAQAASKALGSVKRGVPSRPAPAVPRATAAVALPSLRPAATLSTRPAPTGEQLVASAQQRRMVAAIPAAGAGSPGVGPDLVPPRKTDGRSMSTAETIAWHREQVAKGKHGLVTSR